MATNYATSTYKTALMHKENDQWVKLVDIKTTPDLGGTPDRLETTTLSDRAHTYINGLEGGEEGYDFTANFVLEDYEKLRELEGQIEEYAVWFDDGTTPTDEYEPVGTLGRWSWSGQLSVYVNGVDVNSVREMTISISQSTEIKFEVGEEASPTSLSAGTKTTKTTKETTTAE